MTPAAMFFDAVGTLIHPDPPAPAVYAVVGRRFGGRADAAEIASRFRAAFRRQEEIDRLAGWRTDAEREMARWRAIVAETLTDVADSEACFEALYAHFTRPDAWRVQPEAGPTLRALAERGIHVGLASNFDSRLRGVVAGLAELAPVRSLVVSAEVGWRKPAAAFFDEVRRQAGFPSEKIVFVGDDLANDYQGAKAAGMEAALFDPRSEGHEESVRRVVRLSDLAT